MIFCGIDPGLSGACAFIVRGVVVFEDLPTKRRQATGAVAREIDAHEFAQILRKHMPVDQCALVTLELVGMLGGNKAMQYAASLIDSVAAIRAVCEVCRFPLEFVRPATWQKFYGLGRSLTKDRDMTVAQNKAKAKIASREKAITLYPETASSLARVKDDNRAEALLIAHYGFRHFS